MPVLCVVGARSLSVWLSRFRDDPNDIVVQLRCPLGHRYFGVLNLFLEYVSGKPPFEETHAVQKLLDLLDLSFHCRSWNERRYVRLLSGWLVGCLVVDPP
ncbi:hypothetical protein PIB30_031058 [Stylosanthes scabra]|uniref:Uncharacterized protein n=1 Tax=Stylosanthes scabra TaxID=79078 RepID=A0ABU6RBX8_9FABA|nr:hypothetical protein [Stylosanthes scabra]